MSPVRDSQASEATVSAASSRVFTSEATVTILVSGDIAGATGNLAHGIPQMIPEDQILFWTAEWRELEGRALAQLQRGEFREFANFREMARHLLRGEDED